MKMSEIDRQEPITRSVRAAVCWSKAHSDFPPEDWDESHIEVFPPTMDINEAAEIAVLRELRELFDDHKYWENLGQMVDRLRSEEGIMVFVRGAHGEVFKCVVGHLDLSASVMESERVLG